MTGIVEDRLQRGQCLARAPVAVGDDRDGLVEPHDALDPGIDSAGALSTETSLPPKTGAMRA